MECNGFCGVNDLNPVNVTEKEIHFDKGESNEIIIVD
jgi:hypothetical protein